MRFVDTNVLLYAVSTVREERPKASAARRLLESADLALSVQVIQEFYAQATRQGRKDALTHDQAIRLVESFLRFPTQETTVELAIAAARARKRYVISYWDAAIVEAARLLGCAEILTEDLSHGTDFDGVIVTNPFR